MKKIIINTIKTDSQASNIFDFTRFIAALVVFLFHFYLPLPGYQAVMVFFVLSGYFISSTVLKAVKENRWSWTDYLLKRIVRLWIVLIPCLILTFLWAEVQLSIFGSNQEIAKYLDWKTFLGNLFFLQGILVENFGLNGPLWSLSYEFWYYIMFPCLVLMIWSEKSIHRLVYAFLLILISLVIGGKITLYFLVWLLGAVIPLIKPLNIKYRALIIILFILSTLSVLISMKAYVFLEGLPQIIPDLFIGICFSIWIFLVICVFANRTSKSRFGISKRLAGFSYTLYLSHYPLANIIFTWIGSSLWIFRDTPLSVKLLLAASVLLYAWVLSLLTEKHTARVGKYVSRFIFPNKHQSIKREVNEKVPS
ncbi:acyltransferase [Peribacillus sp. FSL H8-0477]|uniref:acyltransferase family protein n=1 Tax=Peribacillus sp. FSL H8-0477 TaxID=2921388 RepID=UPI0030F6EA60